MTGKGDRGPSAPPRAAETAVLQAAAPFPDAAARDDAVALLRAAGLDSELDRLRESMATILEPLDRQRSDLTALAELIEKDPLQEPAHESAEILEARRRRLLRNQRTFAELADALKRDEADVLAMSSELQRKTAGSALPDASRRLVRESLRVVPCSGCLRLLYDRGWTERDLMPSTLRPTPRAKP